MSHAFLFLAGLAALIVGGHLLVSGASRLALSLGISPLVVGLTVVAFGTSAPEAAVATGAVLVGQGDLAVGNVVGSNIFNVLFVLGASALMAPLVVNSQLIRQEVPVMIGASLLLLVLGLDGRLSLFDGSLLLVLLLAYTVFLVVQSRRASGATRNPHDAGAAGRVPVQLALIAAGLAALVLGADWLVSAASAFARGLGVSELVIGLTIVAAGTSLPEAAASIAAALKGERDMAVGNVVGSSTFNILGCLGLSALAGGQAGLAVPPSVMAMDLWVMLAVALACLPVFLSGHRVTRWEGGFFLAYYAAYVAYLILAAQQHDALKPFSTAMMGFVVPLTVVTLVIVTMRRPVRA
jgi:cation:H+ antiporter